MATFVLVHGMWHGGWCWIRVARRLRAAGHEVYTPTLTGLGERAHLRSNKIDLNTHIQDVVNLLKYEDIQDAILVGHSFGGSIVPVITERIPDRIARYINIDGPVLEDGMALRDTIGDIWDFFRQHAIDSGDEWWIPPVADWTFGVSGADLAWMQSKLTDHPLRTLITPVSITTSKADEIPRTYVSCFENAPPDQLEAKEKELSERSWEYRNLTTGHDAMITMPEELTSILLELIPTSPGE